MKERTLLIFTLLLSVLVLVLHTRGLHGFYYWKYFWYPLLVHFLTGFTVGLLLFILLSQFEPAMSAHHIAIAVVSCVFFVALAWEVFEFANGLTLTPVHYLFDTFKGITMGVVGSLVSLLFSFRTFKKI